MYTEKKRRKEIEMENPKFTIFTGKDGQFYFRLVARNGEPILASEGYTSKSGCENGIASVKKNAVKDDQFRRLTASNGEYYFILVAENGEVIGKSETYKTEQGRDNGIEAVKSTAPISTVEGISKENGITQNHNEWKKEYGKTREEEIHRLKELEIENASLKKMYAELSLKYEALKEIVKKII